MSPSRWSDTDAWRVSGENSLRSAVVSLSAFDLQSAQRNSSSELALRIISFTDKDKSAKFAATIARIEAQQHDSRMVRYEKRIRAGCPHRNNQ